MTQCQTRVKDGIHNKRLITAVALKDGTENKTLTAAVALKDELTIKHSPPQSHQNATKKITHR